MSDSYVAALLVERVGYVAAGKLDRVAAVDAELARFGVSAAVGVVEDAEARSSGVETAARSRGGRKSRA